LRDKKAGTAPLLFYLPTHLAQRQFPLQSI